MLREKISELFIDPLLFLFVIFLALFHVIVGCIVHLIVFVLKYIDSIEQPWFVKFRRCVKRYFRMMFWGKTFQRFRYNEIAVQKGDSYIDKMLEDMLQNKGEDFDPYVLEDSSVGFHKKVMFVNVSGEAKLHDGYIKGLSTLHRAKHCSLQQEDKKLRVRADLGAGELELHYKGSVKFMNFGPTITVTGSLSYIEVFMEFKVDSETGREGRLTKFLIDDMRGMKVRVSGLGPLNWAVNPIISGVTKIFKRFVRNFMENKVEKHISEHIPNYQFPVEGETTETPEDFSTLDTTFSEETPEPETEAPQETPEPETEAPQENPEPKPEENPDAEVNFPETPETSIIDDSGRDESDVGESELESDS